MNSGFFSLVLVIAAAGAVVGVTFWAYRRGRESERLKEMKRDNEAGSRVRDAESAAPDDRGELLERLRRGGKL